MSATDAVRRLRNEYRSSLKAIAAEELVDLVMFRPPAFVLAKVLRSSRVKPLHVTLGSMILGMAGGIVLAVTRERGLAAAAALIWCSTLFDCADGQLARLQKSASAAGRVLDGSIDYVVGLFVFLGLGIRGCPAFDTINWWCIVTAAGSSYAFQAMMYDLFRTKYLEIVARGGSGRNVSGTAGNKASSRPPGIVRWAYRQYKVCQELMSNWFKGIADDVRTRRYVRIWGLNGTSTHVVLLGIACLLNRPDFYLLYLILIGNGMALGLTVLWQRNSGNRRAPVKIALVHTSEDSQ